MFGTDNLLVDNEEAMVYGVEEKINYNDYNITGILENDISVMRLERDVEYVIDEENNRFIVNSVCVPSNGFTLNKNKRVKVSGFGLTERSERNDNENDLDAMLSKEPITLRETNLLVPNEHQCRQICNKTLEQKFNNSQEYSEIISLSFDSNYIMGHKFCLSTSLADKLDYTYAHNVYSGDSGGPVLSTSGNRTYTIGVISVILYNTLSIPLSAATNLTYYLDWIENICNIEAL